MSLRGVFQSDLGLGVNDLPINLLVRAVFGSSIWWESVFGNEWNACCHNSHHPRLLNPEILTSSTKNIIIGLGDNRLIDELTDDANRAQNKAGNEQIIRHIES